MKTVKLALSLSILLAISVDAQTSTATGMQIPAMPVSKPGQCHALVHVPAKMGTEVEKVLVQPIAETLEVIPAKYEWIEKQVIVKDEDKTFEIVPATYKVVEEKILIEPERLDFEVVPAKFEETNVKVLTRPAMRVWKRSTSGYASLSGEVMRLIEQENKYKVLSKRVMVAPPQFTEVKIDAVYSTVEKKVIDKPAAVREVVIPAEFKTVRVKKLVDEAKEVRTPTEEVYEEIAKDSVVQQASMKWQRVPCDSDLNETNILAIQKGLKEAGYDVGVDGKFGAGSMKMLEDFQQRNGLATGAITIETMKKLGVNIK